MKPAGYLINTRNGIEGERGFIYDYITAENGLFLESRTPLLEARICVAPAPVRGLAPLEEYIRLPQGKIPGHLYELAVSVLYTDVYRECYLAITWDGEYHLKMPSQYRKESRVDYQVLDSTVMDIHSHGTAPAFFSTDYDNPDEQGFRLSMVAGRLQTDKPVLDMRLAMYGYYLPVEKKDVFDVYTQ